MKKPLLPSGCYDLLPPDAAHESAIVSRLLTTFGSFGYEQVAPPLLEYTESLLSGRGGTLSPQIFRVMDPGAGKVMGFRADITMQVARIASSRLMEAPRPLRLCYAGSILRMNPEQLRSERQLCQAGAELIGGSGPEADAEVIFVAAEGLQHIGLARLSIDLNLPGIVNLLLADEKLGAADMQDILQAIARKDSAALLATGLAWREALAAFIELSGAAQRVLPALLKLKLPDAAARQVKDLAVVVALLDALPVAGQITLDITENRGFEYHTGICFSLFAEGAATELGRGGRYHVEPFDPAAPHSEATGFTLYVDVLRDIAPLPAPADKVFIPGGIADKDAARLRKEGKITVHALPEDGDSPREAERLGCTTIWKGGALHPLK